MLAMGWDGTIENFQVWGKLTLQKGIAHQFHWLTWPKNSASQTLIGALLASSPWGHLL